MTPKRLIHVVGAPGVALEDLQGAVRLVEGITCPGCPNITDLRAEAVAYRGVVYGFNVYCAECDAFLKCYGECICENEESSGMDAVHMCDCTLSIIGMVNAAA